jgi:hypothetical protein
MMLGCHEFCGYYEWTFHYVRRRWGQEAVARLWAEAIGGESQRHYTEAAQAAGLAGLYRTWVQTGEDEACDWTFTLDEARNVLRCDMRKCPSKGFLLTRDMQADEDYCDHCAGWMIPLLEQVGVEVSEHEHNHLGQCWCTMRRKDRRSEPLPVACDIRRDPRWNTGYLDRWEHNRKQPLIPGLSAATDPCQVLADWFAAAEQIVVVAEEEQAGAAVARSPAAGLLTDRVYAAVGDLGLRPLAVLIGHEEVNLPGLAARFRHASAERRPLLLHPYLPSQPVLDFTAAGLPRPLPILPLLIRTGRYVHQPGGPPPATRALLIAAAHALGHPFVVLG